jgi:antirestriction protein
LKDKKMSDSRIYVGTYAKYNDGSIAGAWLDLSDYSDAEEFSEACQALHGDGEHEFMFQDWEGIPDGMVSESHLSAEFWDWVQLDDDDQELLSVYRSEVDQSGSLESARDDYMGTFSSAENWAEEYLNDSGMLSEVPENLRNYIDFEAYARDASYGGISFVNHDGSVWVFSA